MLSNSASFLRAAVCLLTLAGCAVQYSSVQLTEPLPLQAKQPARLVQDVEILLPTGYQRKLAAGSRWLKAGSVPQGLVYRPYMDVFTLEGSHIHEAYLVVENGRLVGFYLPAERGFSALQSAIPIPLQE